MSPPPAAAWQTKLGGSLMVPTAAGHHRREEGGEVHPGLGSVHLQERPSGPQACKLRTETLGSGSNSVSPEQQQQNSNLMKKRSNLCSFDQDTGDCTRATWAKTNFLHYQLLSVTVLVNELMI